MEREPASYLGPSLQPDGSLSVAVPVKMRIIITAKMSGFVASTPGAFRAMCVRENSPMGLPISSSNVALQALATLEVPVTKHTHQRNVNKSFKKGSATQLDIQSTVRDQTGQDAAAAAGPRHAHAQRRGSQCSQ